MSGQWDQWERRESGPAGAEHTVLLLPGGMCTAAFFDELMAEPALAQVRLVAVTLPGNGGTPAGADLGMATSARLTAGLAAELGADLVVGHSMGANVALEMAGSAAFTHPVILLAPSFSRADEAPFLRGLDSVSRWLGPAPYALLCRLMGLALKQVPVPAARREELAREFRRNDPRAIRRGVHEYLSYLDAYGSVAPRLAGAGVPAWVVHGEKGDGGITAQERRTLEAAPDITVITIPGASYFTQIEEPALVADLIVAALATSRPATGERPAGT